MDLQPFIDHLHQLLSSCEFLSPLEKENYIRLLPSLSLEQLQELEHFLTSSLEEFALLRVQEEQVLSGKIAEIKHGLDEEIHMTRKVIEEEDQKGESSASVALINQL